MIIQLLHSYVKNLQINHEENFPENEKGTFNFNFKEFYLDENQNEFEIHFDLVIKSKDNLFLKLIYISIFKTENEIDEEFKNSSFPKINAPAIAFPFLRSFIATITINSGYKSIILPTINFTKKLDTNQ